MSSIPYLFLFQGLTLMNSKSSLTLCLQGQKNGKFSYVGWLGKIRSNHAQLINKLLNCSGYVYDAVWLYALALEKLVQTDETYLQNLHSNRSVEAFVDIIKNIDFHGVSGRINFHGRSSRLSDIDIIQWYKNDQPYHQANPGNNTIVCPNMN